MNPPRSLSLPSISESPVLMCRFNCDLSYTFCSQINIWYIIQSDISYVIMKTSGTRYMLLEQDQNFNEKSKSLPIIKETSTLKPISTKMRSSISNLHLVFSQINYAESNQIRWMQISQIPKPHSNTSLTHPMS